MKFISKIQLTFTLAKLTALLVVILSAFWTVYEKSNEKTNQLTGWLYSNKPYDFSKIALALYNSLFSYSGWYNLNHKSVEFYFSNYLSFI